MHYVYMFFLGRATFYLLPDEKRSCFWEKLPSFQIIQEISCVGKVLPGKTIFSGGPKKISYFHVFFRKDHLSFSVHGIRSCFGERKISSFPIIQERSCSSAIFLERPSFQDVRNKKIWFSVQWQVVLSKIKDKSITHSIYRIQNDDFITALLW